MTAFSQPIGGSAVGKVGKDIMEDLLSHREARREAARETSYAPEDGLVTTRIKAAEKSVQTAKKASALSEQFLNL